MQFYKRRIKKATDNSFCFTKAKATNSMLDLFKLFLQVV